MIFVIDGKAYVSDEARYRETCRSCGAMGYGNMTCSACVSQWPRFGHSQEDVDRLLKILGDRPPEPPFGTRIQ